MTTDTTVAKHVLFNLYLICWFNLNIERCTLSIITSMFGEKYVSLKNYFQNVSYPTCDECTLTQVTELLPRVTSFVSTVLNVYITKLQIQYSSE